MAKTMPKIIPMRMADDDTTRRWELIEDWMYTLGTVTFHVPRGFIFDGASIPRVFTAIYAPTGYLFLAALIHDFCYQHGKYHEAFMIDGAWSHPYPMPVSRSMADIIFKQIAVIEYPNHRIKSFLAHKALRIGGWVAWNTHRRREKEK